MHPFRIAAWLSAALLIGCASAPAPPPGPVELIAPAEGYSVVYVFRPRLDQVRKSDTPSLFVDDAFIAKLPFASYTRLELPPGKHRLKLVAGPSEASTWNAESSFDIGKNEMHFVALWNSNQPRSQTGTVPIQVPGVLIFLPLYGPQSSSKPGVQFEPVARDVAESALPGLRYTP